jgi:hypothetical protein
MNRLNLAIVAGMFAFAAILGTVAATHTVSLGVSHRRAATATLRSQSKKLDGFEAALRKQLARKPPTLPRVPKTPVAAPAPAAVAQSQQQVVYRRPPPVVVVKHTHHGDDGGEHGDRGDGGGGDD